MSRRGSREVGPPAPPASAGSVQRQLSFGLPPPPAPPPAPVPTSAPALPVLSGQTVPSAVVKPVAGPASSALEAPPDLWEGSPPFDEEDLEGDRPEVSPSTATGPRPSAAPITATSTTTTSATTASPPGEKREARVFTVGELVRGVRIVLESRFADVRVEGEISGFRRTGPGHFYFCLKDGEAQIECVMFSREAGRVKWKPGDGQLVRCRGRLTIYEGRGKFQMSVLGMEPAGAGLLALAFEELKRKLAAEGLFAPERKRRLPFFPRRIGVVTSPGGAVIKDIIRVAHRRAAVPILLAPTPVQGEGAAFSIIAALRAVVRAPDIDVVILARGGGSLEDLWCFNDEALARAIAACPVPVISAVGHETDFTISDFVADVRAPTPSAAAELAVPVAEELRAELAVLGRRAARAVTAEISRGRLVIERARGRIGDPRRLVNDRRQAVDELAARAAQALRLAMQRRRSALRAEESRLFRAHPQRRIAEQRKTLAMFEQRLGAAGRTRLGERRRALDGLLGKLSTLSPLGVLERGYSLAHRPDGHLVTTASQLAGGDSLFVRFHDGEVRTTVEESGTSSKVDRAAPGASGTADEESSA